MLIEFTERVTGNPLQIHVDAITCIFTRVTEGGYSMRTIVLKNSITLPWKPGEDIMHIDVESDLRP